MQKVARTDPAPILQVEDLSVVLDHEALLSHVTFSLERARITAVVGPNGSGKTTLLRALLGLIPYEGRIAWAPGVTLGYVPQRFSVPAALPLTVTEFFLLKSKRFWRPAPSFREHLPHELALVGLPSSMLERSLGSLSSGQVQRLLVAWAMIGHPEVLLLDEPTASVDVGFSETLYALMHRMTEERETTILFVSHDLNVVSRHASQVLCLNRRLVCQGSPQEVLTPASLRSIFGDVVLHRVGPPGTEA